MPQTLSADIKHFARSLRRELPAAASGGLGVLLTFLLLLVPDSWLPRLTVAVLANVAFGLAGFRIWQHERHQVNDLTAKLATVGRLELLHKPGLRRFEEVSAYFPYGGSKTVLSVGIKNAGGSRLTSIRLGFVGITPDEGGLPNELPMLLSFNELNPGETAFREIVTLINQGPQSDNLNDSVATLHIPFKIDSAAGERTIDVKTSYDLMIRATCAETQSITAVLRIYVEDGGRGELKMKVWS